MTTYRELVNALRSVAPDHSRPVLVHASLGSLGQLAGGVDSVVGALLSTFESVMTPTFTYATMLIPEVGPPENGLDYGSGREQNALAEFFHPELPADRSMGAVAEALRKTSKARRSTHPILSFAGMSVDPLLEAQSIQAPLGPIRVLAEQGGWVLLLGVDHTRNVTIHLAEQLAGRKQFTRWALTPQGVVECPDFPGCSEGFNAITPHLESYTRWVQLAEAKVQAVPAREVVRTARKMILDDPLALLCERENCQRCQAVRKASGMG